MNLLDNYCVPLQDERIKNTWAGEPSKVVLLGEVVRTVKEERLLENVQRSGRAVLSGFQELQVHNCDLIVCCERFVWCIWTSQAPVAPIASASGGNNTYEYEYCLWM